MVVLSILFDRRFRPSGGMLVVGAAWVAIAALDRRLFGATGAGKGLLVLLVILGFGIVGHLVRRLVAQQSGDLIQWRYDVRIRGVVLLRDARARASSRLEYLGAIACRCLRATCQQTIYAVFRSASPFHVLVPGSQLKSLDQAQ